MTGIPEPYRYGKALRGAEVPDLPPFDYGRFQPMNSWCCYLSWVAVRSAWKAGALDAKLCGPRGGQWLAAREDRWAAWAAIYRERSRKRAEGIAARESEARLAPPVFCPSCKHWSSTFDKCERPGPGARRVRFGPMKACSRFYEPRGSEEA